MKHGIYIISESQVEQFENDWLGGSNIDIITTTYTSGHHDVEYITWEPGVTGQEKRDSLERTFGDTSRQLMTIYHFAGNESGDYSSAANGSLDAKYREFGSQLVSLGMEDTIIVGSHEFNLGWSNRYPNDPANYASGFARMVREMMSVNGANFNFVYAPGGNRLGVTEEAWPVDAPEWNSDLPTPIVAPTLYDTSPDYPDDIENMSQSEQEQMWESVWTGWHIDILEMWKSFADRVGADIAFREWGVATPDFRNASGGDNPYFIKKMFDYMSKQGFLFQTYWNEETWGAGTGGHTIYPTSDSRLLAAGTAWKEEVLSNMSTENETDSTDDTSDADGSTIDNEIGGYVKPAAGTLDWHEPLNQNFQDIESDMQHLLERLKRLE